MSSHLQQLIFKTNSKSFEDSALKIFNYQAKNNPVYEEFLYHMKTDPRKVRMVSEIPFLPVDFFKSHKVICKGKTEKVIFTSSGTTGITKSRHYVADINLYEESFVRTFKSFYGNPADYCIIALMPDAEERKDSSLVYMAGKLIRLSENPLSNFYLNDFDKLIEVLKIQKNKKQKTIILGLSYALMDFAENIPMRLRDTIIMETGGMKGKREEMPKVGLHSFLKKSFGVNEIHSEYGMTELLSQAYSSGNQKYFCPPWMKIMIRDPYDPFSLMETGKTGGINIIDLANIYSCSFIETRDMGKLFNDGSFEVLGRLDQSEIRGCNLMME